MTSRPNRREVLVQGVALVGAGRAAGCAPGPSVEDRPKGEPFRYCLNTSTLHGQKLGIAEVIDIAARAGLEKMRAAVKKSFE